MTESQIDELRTRPKWVGPWFAAIWLFYLADPVAKGIRGHHWVGVAATLVFAVAYVVIWWRARETRMGTLQMLPTPWAVRALALLVVLALVMMRSVGEPGIAAVVYLGVTAVMILPFRAALSTVVVLVAGTLACGWIPGWGSQAGVALGVLAGSVAMFGVRAVMARNVALLRAQEDNAKLLVDNERNRFARDLHDILGHSLTVITVKAELATRLFDVDPERARSEVADLERLARDALADVRRAVEGYRDLTLPGEIARARTALQAAEIRAELPNSTDDVPTDLRELFAWTIREGVTNVIRHSAARTCTVRLTPTSAEVIDDGRGCGAGGGDGHGLVGLRERAAALGATVSAGPVETGFALRVATP